VGHRCKTATFGGKSLYNGDRSQPWWGCRGHRLEEDEPKTGFVPPDTWFASGRALVWGAGTVPPRLAEMAVSGGSTREMARACRQRWAMGGRLLRATDPVVSLWPSSTDGRARGGGGGRPSFTSRLCLIGARRRNRVPQWRCRPSTATRRSKQLTQDVPAIGQPNPCYGSRSCYCSSLHMLLDLPASSDQEYPALFDQSSPLSVRQSVSLWRSTRSIPGCTCRAPERAATRDRPGTTRWSGGGPRRRAGRPGGRSAAGTPPPRRST